MNHVITGNCQKPGSIGRSGVGHTQPFGTDFHNGVILRHGPGGIVQLEQFARDTWGMTRAATYDERAAWQIMDTACFSSQPIDGRGSLSAGQDRDVELVVIRVKARR